MARAVRASPAALPMVGEQVPVRCVLMRGGTSKGVFLRTGDLPADPALRDRVILALFGSPDPRQIDGLGGADILTSKVAIIGPPTRPDADVDYTFGQVSITEPVVDYDINCGNLSAAVGVYAVEEGFVRPAEPLTPVRVHNTNTGKVYTALVPVRSGRPAVEGDCVVDGVPDPGAEILLDFAGAAGAATGRLLPTGAVRDVLPVAGLGPVEVTIVDLANLCVFFPARAAGMSGTEGPQTFTARMLEAMMAVKEAAAGRLGVPRDGLVPLPVAVAPPAPFATLRGATVEARSVDLLVRLAGGRPPVLHKAFPGTAAACAAVAAVLPGSVPAAVARTGGGDRIRLGHPSGIMVVAADARPGPRGDWQVLRAAYARTARRLMEGYAFVRLCKIGSPPDGR
ncbi:MAG: PrpF domain-containing protein [Armatimonadota bacterium]|nr:PrpF domain-containing protein [Armatimonadota bacterium]MDR7486037.1 PrpF domain-containing protein [Armatimonadota bacterium]MDR7532608.1 PrpF domain-containing protein [Armatimonadota bacterium]MDR7536183.1 PrpF domain-containing protein [Armatimonadota bacterium]